MIKPGQIIGRRQGGEPEDERDHFYACPACGQMVDMRDLGQVFHHEVKGHRPLPEAMTTWPPIRRGVAAAALNGRNTRFLSQIVETTLRYPPRHEKPLK